jgi:hypothetical protein
MQRVTFILAVFFLLVLTGPASAAGYPDIARRVTDNWTVGTIQSLSRNTVEILDEKLNQERRFVYFGNLQEFKVGERVRIIFDPENSVVKTIKKITPLEYRQDGQNLGYVHPQ